jgi:hypothetical protein
MFFSPVLLGPLLGPRDAVVLDQRGSRRRCDPLMGHPAATIYFSSPVATGCLIPFPAVEFP